MYSRPSSPSSQNPPITTASPAAADQAVNSGAAIVIATDRASSVSANMYPDVASSGSTITSAPSVTAAAIVFAMSSVLAARSAILGAIWQQAILVRATGSR